MCVDSMKMETLGAVALTGGYQCFGHDLGMANEDWQHSKKVFLLLPPTCVCGRCRVQRSPINDANVNTPLMSVELKQFCRVSRVVPDLRGAPPSPSLLPVDDTGVH